jgi:hypothetical protein
MTRIIWNDIGQKVYHAGIDRGTFYFGTIGVPWFGLVSVTESPSGGDAEPVFLDGTKVQNVPGRVDFDATIQALSAPIEFASCAGRLELAAGLYATDQPKEKFGFSYRTLIGNDVLDTNFGYKIHVVYNAMAKISDFTHTTKSGSSSVSPYSWAITTTPIMALPNKRPTSHFIFDTNRLSPDSINLIEAILYGDDDDGPRLPTLGELGTILNS